MQILIILNKLNLRALLDVRIYVNEHLMSAKMNPAFTIMGYPKPGTSTHFPRNALAFSAPALAVWRVLFLSKKHSDTAVACPKYKT
jgi:hypothetical protein